jgi:hypothetical protein
MRNLTDVLLCLNLFFGAMVTGAMALEFMAILPTFRDLGPAAGLRLHRSLSPRPWRYLPVCGAIATLSAVTALVIDDHFSHTHTTMLIVGLACVAGFLFFSANLYRREDLRARALPDEPTETDWNQAVDRLHRLHVARMVLWLVAYGLFVVVAVRAGGAA